MVSCGEADPEPPAAKSPVQRQEAPAPDPSEAPSAPTRELTVRVLMPDGKPAAVVPVRFLDTQLIPRISLLRATGGEPDAEKLLEVLGEERTTSGDGRVVFSSSGGPILASAELGDLYVMQPFAPPAEDAEELTLTLSVDRSVRGTAVGPEGQRLRGVPISLAMELASVGEGAAGSEHDGPKRRWIDLAVRETSGDDASVRFRDGRGGVQRSSQGDQRFGLRAALPGLEESAPVLFDPDRPPSEPIEVSVPALSTTIVEVLSSTGQLVDMEADVFLEESTGGPGASRLRARLQSGRASFRAVIPETLLRVTVQPLEGGAAFEGVGPSALQAGDTVTISVTVPGGR